MAGRSLPEPKPMFKASGLNLAGTVENLGLSIMPPIMLLYREQRPRPVRQKPIEAHRISTNRYAPPLDQRDADYIRDMAICYIVVWRGCNVCHKIVCNTQPTRSCRLPIPDANRGLILFYLWDFLVHLQLRGSSTLLIDRFGLLVRPASLASVLRTKAPLSVLPFAQAPI
jgi:hypothetical protein